MQTQQSHIQWIEMQKQAMVTLVCDWVNVNTYSYHLEGLDVMAAKLIKAFAPLEADYEKLPLAPKSLVTSGGVEIRETMGSAVRFTKRPKAKRRVFLSGHMDTVFKPSCPFQKAYVSEDGTKIHGPGSADMKGGLVILLKALEAFEKTEEAKELGWEVLITPDEEIGSSSSELYFKEAALRNDVALIFEPSFIDGALVSARKGSINFSITAKGKAAHAGRDFHSGKNAITAIANFIIEAEKLNKKSSGITFNVGKIEGGEATNIVADFSLCRCNIRMDHPKDRLKLTKQLQAIVDKLNKKGGAKLKLHIETLRPPKPFDKQHEKLYETFRSLAEELGEKMEWRPSGGVCDGNILADAGLVTIDTLGAVGANIHTYDEYALTESLVKHAQLTAYYLSQLAKGEIPLEKARRT